MQSIYKNMQPYPNEKDQIYYGPYCYQGIRAAPTQMHVNPYWPWGSNHGGAPPFVCHGRCNRSYLPAYCAWGSPCTDVALHHYNYPSFPIQYMPPPSCYAIEQPRYEYEKNVPGQHHCCGCPNHPLHKQKCVRIEEEEPERERRKDISAVPSQSKNSPYPIMWLPPDYFSNKERKANDMRDRKDGAHDVQVNGKDSPYPIVCLPPDYSSNKEQRRVKSTGDQKDGSCNVPAHENGIVAGQHPALWNGWLPFDLNDFVLNKNRGEGEENHQQDDGNGNFPFPLFWVPYRPEERDSGTYKLKDDNTAQSLEADKGSSGEKNFNVSGENISDRAVSKTKDIPVKEGEGQVGKETSRNEEKKRDASVKDGALKRVDNGEEGSPKEGSKGKSPSPPKSSKLPPVCLRVDPLPRRKNGNGSSRSLSPPSNKQKPDSQSKDASTVCNSSGNKERAKILQNEFEEDKNIKTIEVVDGITSQEKTMDGKIGTPVKLPAECQVDISTNQEVEKPKDEHTENDAVIEGQSEDTVSAGGENEGLLRALGMKSDDVKKSCKRELSEEEAAVIIQSVYRGFDVRRWDPVKKLKQIAKVQEQIADVKNLIQAMKSCSDIQGCKKQKNIVAETIMSLLLKLDTIQGLHPSIREVRKSVVRELVSLQEELDSLKNEKPQDSQVEQSMMTRGEVALDKSEDVISSHIDHKAISAELMEALKKQIDGQSNHDDSDISEANLIESEKTEKGCAVNSTEIAVDSAPEPIVGENEKYNEVCDAHQNQTDGGSNHDNSQVVEAYQVGQEECEKTEKDVSDHCASKDVELASEAATAEDEKSDEVLENDETVAVEGHMDLVLGQCSEVSSLQNYFSGKTTVSAATDSDRSVSELAELPVGVLDDVEVGGDVLLPVGVHDVAIEGTAREADQAKDLEEASVKSLLTSGLHEISDDEESNQTSVTHEVVDLPLNDVSVEPDIIEDCNSDYKLGTEQEADLKIEDAIIKADECIAQYPQSSIDETRDMTGAEGAAEAKSDDNRNDLDSHITQQNNTIKRDNSQEDSEDKKLQLIEDSHPQVSELASVPQQCEDPYDSGEVSKEQPPRDVEESEDVSQQCEECNAELKGTPEEQVSKGANAQEENDADPTSPARDDVKVSNKKLIEENEKLRDMIEKLIKSGQEQLTAISGLSGRVEDLEKKLSRRRKLKVRQYRAPRSGSSCMAKFDGPDSKGTMGMAM